MLDVTNKNILEVKSFKVPGTFESMYAAQRWLSDCGYCYGSTDAKFPTAVMKGSDYYAYDLPHKMHNFTKKQKDSVHGIMFGNMRDGTVTVHLYE